MRKKIAIDFDGTIADTNRVKSQWAQSHLGIKIPPWRCSRTDCEHIIGKAAYKQMGDYAYEREGTMNANEVAGALRSIFTLSKTCDLEIITARAEDRIVYLGEWLEKSGIKSYFKSIHSSDKTSKAKICTAIGADVLIDDDYRHVKDLASEGVFPILLQDGNVDNNAAEFEISFCINWGEVMKILAAKITPPSL